MPIQGHGGIIRQIQVMWKIFCIFFRLRKLKIKWNI
jgi:hypothetical protein